MSQIRYGDQKQILVGVHLCGNYSCPEGKPAYPKLQVHWWTEKGQFEKLPKEFREGNSVFGIWNEQCSLWDTPKEETLPEQIFVLVLGSQYYDGHYAPTSWFATEACATREQAETKAKENGREHTWYFVVPANRFVPAT